MKGERHGPKYAMLKYQSKLLRNDSSIHSHGAKKREEDMRRARSWQRSQAYLGESVDK